MVHNPEQVREIESLCQEYCKAYEKKFDKLEPDERAVLVKAALKYLHSASIRDAGSNRFKLQNENGVFRLGKDW